LQRCRRSLRRTRRGDGRLAAGGGRRPLRRGIPGVAAEHDLRRHQRDPADAHRRAVAWPASGEPPMIADNVVTDNRTIPPGRARRGLYGAKELEPLIAPRSIAVVGASNRGGYGYQVLRAITAGSFAGPLWAVHPSGEPVAGVTAVESVGALPEPVDLAIIGVRAER